MIKTSRVPGVDIAVKILIADDDPAIVDALQFALEGEGYDVETTIDGQTVTVARDSYPDLVLLDIWMSGTDGREIARQLKAANATKNIPVIMISANRDMAAMAGKAGANDFLAKPFDIDVLLTKVQNLTQKH